MINKFSIYFGFTTILLTGIILKGMEQPIQDAKYDFEITQFMTDTMQKNSFTRKPNISFFSNLNEFDNNKSSFINNHLYFKDNNPNIQILCEIKSPNKPDQSFGIHIPLDILNKLSKEEDTFKHQHAIFSQDGQRIDSTKEYTVKITQETKNLIIKQIGVSLIQEKDDSDTITAQLGMEKKRSAASITFYRCCLTGTCIFSLACILLILKISFIR